MGQALFFTFSLLAGLRLRFHSSLLNHPQRKSRSKQCCCTRVSFDGGRPRKGLRGCVEKLTLFFKAPSSLSHFCTRYQENLHSSVGEARASVSPCVWKGVWWETRARATRENEGKVGGGGRYCIHMCADKSGEGTTEQRRRQARASVVKRQERRILVRMRWWGKTQRGCGEQVSSECLPRASSIDGCGH